MVQYLVDVTFQALNEIWQGFILLLPRLFGALIVFLVGWILASIVERIVRDFLKFLKFDQIFEKGGWIDALEKAEIKTKPSEFVGGVAKWVILIVFLITSVKVLFLGYGLEFRFLDEIVSWLPNLIIAVIIFVVASVIAEILSKIIHGSLEKVRVPYGKAVAQGVKWAIYILAFLMILRQIGVTPTIIDALVFGFVATFALAFGLAFGLGGKEIAAEILKEIKKKISE